LELSELVFHAFELNGTAAFAVSGAMVALKKRMDIFGVVFIGITTALGGGIIRDVLLGYHPPKAFLSSVYIAVAAVTSALMFAVAFLLKDRYLKSEKKAESVNNIFDAVGLGAFTVTGIRTAMDAGNCGNAFLAVFLGVITGIGGGLLRDLLTGEIPVVLQKRIYAVASIVGGCAYYLLYRAGVDDTVAIFAGVALVFVIRMLSTAFRWNLPKAF